MYCMYTLHIYTQLCQLIYNIIASKIFRFKTVYNIMFTIFLITQICLNRNDMDYILFYNICT